MRAHQTIRNIGVIPSLCLALLSGGCAEQPPLSSNLSGRQLIVTMTYNFNIDSSQYYYFLLNAENVKGAEGPIAVFGPPYGNGFATAGGPTDPGPTHPPAQGFTNYVEFNEFVPSGVGYGLYHVSGALENPNTPPSYNLIGTPISYITPGLDSSNTRTLQTLQFTIDLAQLFADSNGNSLLNSNPASAVAQANALRYIQFNIVSTSAVPTTLISGQTKYTDSLGDTANSTDRSSWIELDLSQQRTYRNTDTTNPLKEIANDVYGGPDAPIDLIDWSIEVVQK